MEVPLRTILCFLLFCLTSTLADPKCSSCRGAGGPFVQGNVYKYNLEGLSVTKLPGSPDDVSSLAISATAEVFAESSCQYVLKLSNVEVKSADGKKHTGLNEDCAKPVKFSYSDGKLDGICGEADDRGAGLNIKRAVISLLSSVKKQDVGVETGYEHDIFGICPTDFEFSKSGSKLTIQKTRNLNRCALREEFNFPFPTTPYQAVQSSFGAFETSPLFGGELKVIQEIDNGVLQKASGEEHYKYTPFVNHESRVTVEVTYKLSLEGSSPGSIPANVDSPKSLYYEAAHDADGVNNHDKIAAALQKATAALDPEAKPEAAKEFSNLVHTIEQGSKADILQVYNGAQGKTAKDLFLDGLLYAGSADSVEAAAELLKSGQIPKESAVRWYLDLNFVKHTSRGSLKSLMPLLSGNDVPHQAYLGIGSLAGKFCLEHSQLCQTSPEFKELVLQLAAPLAGGCKVDSHEKENNVIASLKGLRNTRHLPDEVAHKISQCATDKSAKTRVRVVAIEAFFADASKPELEQAATSILKDVEEDSELRIKAYLALVEHPCPKTADTIKELIDNEPINQVGTFIVSHLRNLRASVSPEKEAAKKLFGNIISKKKYPFDQRKFSRNYEVSYSLDALNLGAVGEVNRIFSQKSFIPRSVSMNLTTQLFGHSVNLAEIGLRAENLERILEKYFGPKGVFKTKGAKFFDDMTDHAEEALKKAKEQAEASRPKRSISKQDTEIAASKIKLGPDYDDLDLDLDLSVKLFGSDIAWFNYHHKQLDYNGLKSKFNEKLDESLDKSKAIDIDYKKARTFLDAGITYPTGLGLGLKVKVNGNSAVNIKVKGQIDVKAIMNNPKNAHIALQVVPSASLELKSLFLVDADIVEAGLKVTGNLHSSTGSDLTVKVLEGNGLDIKLGLPVKNQEIINFHSDVVSVVKEKKSVEVESPIKFNVKRQEYGGCFDQLSVLLGLTVCGEVSVPMDGFKFISPAYGPSKATLRIEKDDESLTAYHFKALYNEKVPDQVSLEVLLDTPNSKTNRKFSFLIQANKKPQKQLIVSLQSPFHQAHFEGLVIDTESEQALSAKLVSGGSEYFLKVGARVSQEGNRKKYEPLLVYKYPESTKSDRNWIGKKGASKGGKQQASAGITGAVYVEKNPGTQFRKYELKSVTLTTSSIKLTVDGTVTIDENLLSTDLKASYDKETFTLSSTIQKLDSHKYIAKLEFVPSQYPDIAGSIKWEYEKTPHQVENKLVIIHGQDLKSDSSRISITQLLKYKYDSMKSFEFNTENTVTYPLLAISGTVKGGATPKTLNYDIDVTYDKTQVASKLDAKVATKHPTDYSIDFEGKTLGNSVCLTSKHERVSNTKSKFTNSLELKPGGKYSLNGHVESGSKQGEVFKSLSADLKMPHEPKNIKVKAEVKQNSKEDELEFELIAGNKHIIDVEFELTKTPEPKGSFKLLLQKIIDGQGSFHTAGGKSTGSFHLNILKTGRKIEGSGEVSKTGSHLKGVGDLLFDAKKDPSKKIHIETDTEYSEKSIDSKNSLHILNHKSEVNVKLSLDGSFTDGTLIGDAEFVLPNGRVVAAKVNRVFHLTPEDKNVQGTWELLEYESKGAQPRKWQLKLAGKNINPTKKQFDGQADFTYVTPNKGDVVVHVAGKKIPTGDKWAIAGEGSLSGSLLKTPISTKLNAEVSDQLLKGHLTSDKKLPPAHYDFELKTGNDIAVHASGKINLDQFNNEIELKLPQLVKENVADTPITSLKWQTSNTINLLTSEDSEFKVLSSNALHWNGDKFVKVSSDVYHKKFDTHGKLTWESHVLSLRTLNYKLYNDEASEKGELDLDLQWEGKKADLNVKVDGYSGNPVQVKISSNVPEHGKYVVDIYSKVSSDGKSGETAISGTANNQPFSYSGKYSLSESSPYVDIILDTPQGKSKVYGKLEKKGDDHALVESNVHLQGLNLDLNGEINVHSFKDFYVKLNIDSPELKINKLDFEAKSEKTKSAANRITFHGKSAEKEISGSLGLVSKGVAPDVHFEGSGSITVGENTHPIHFTLKSTKTELSKGFQYDILADATVGKHSGSIKTLVLKDGGLHKFERSDKYCYENDCKNDEYLMIYEEKGPDGSDYDVKVDIKLGVSPSSIKVLKHPLLIKCHATSEGWKYDDSIEIEYGPKKIQYKEYLNKDATGFELTLPKRIIAGDIVYHLKDKNPVSLKIEANFWLDKKNSPDKKTSLVLNSEANKISSYASSLSSEARFNTPGLKEFSVCYDYNLNTKDHVISSKFEADIFAKKAQKLVAEYKAVGKKEKDGYTATESLLISSKGLNIEAQVDSKLSLVQKTSLSYSLSGHYLDSNQAKREAVAKISVDPKAYSALVKIPECTLYAANFAIEKGNKEYHAKGSIEILGLKFDEVLEVKETQVKFTAIQKKEKNPQLDWTIGFVPGQVAEISANFNKNPLLSLEVALDDAHFLKSKHSYNTDAAKDLVKLYKENSIALTKEASRVIKESAAKLAHEATYKLQDIQLKGTVNLKPAVQYFQKELEELKDEVSSNQEIQDAIDFFNKSFGTILKQIGVILAQITETSERLITIFNDALKKVTESVNAVIPKLKKQYEEAFEIVLNQVEALLDFATNIIDDVLDKIKEHKKDIQELIDVFTDFIHEVGQTFSKTFGDIYKEIKDFATVFWEQVQTVYDQSAIKQKLQELTNYKIPDQYWENYHDLIETINQVLPTPELQQLLKSVSSVLEKIVKHQAIDKPEVLDQLYKELVAAVRSVISIIEAHRPGGHSASVPTDVTLPTPSFGLFVAPPGTFRFSLYNWIRSTDLPTLSEIVNAYRPTHSPLDVIPPFKASALILGGSEFFTFDKKHYSFKGSCSYILSKDVIDGNFTIAANMEAGKLKSVAVLDHENSIELLHDNKVLVNGQPTDLPAHTGDLHMWRRYNDGTGFATDSGLMAFCTPHLESCAFSINGFYFAKTRGLFGTYNNEPYDDNIVPEGKTAKSTSEFANSWKISPQCPDGAVHEQSAPPAEECTKLFSGDSNLRNCFPLQNPDNFREACNKLVAEASGEGKIEQACNIAKSYAGYCYYVNFMKVNIPDYCGKCHVGSESLKIGESTPVKTPQKEADVVFMIEQLEDNEDLFKELISPLVSTLTNDLKEHGITDVKFGLIGFGAPEQHWPSIYTFNGEFNGFTGSAKNIYFSKVENITEPKLSDRIKELQKQIQIETGTSKISKAFKEAVSYPFRPEAAKTIVGVMASDCDTSILPFRAFKHILHKIHLLDSGIVLNLVAPLRDLELEGKDEKTAANVVGFDSYTVYTQSEAKRKVLKGDEEAYKHLKYKSNLCLDLALGSNGAVFSSSNFVNGKPNLRKNFLQVLSNKITDSITSVEVKQECKCELDRGMIAKTKCKIVSKKEKEALSVKGGVKGGVKA